MADWDWKKEWEKGERDELVLGAFREANTYYDGLERQAELERRLAARRTARRTDFHNDDNTRAITQSSNQQTPLGPSDPEYALLGQHANLPNRSFGEKEKDKDLQTHLAIIPKSQQILLEKDRERASGKQLSEKNNISKESKSGQNLSKSVVKRGFISQFPGTSEVSPGVQPKGQVTTANSAKATKYNTSDIVSKVPSRTRALKKDSNPTKTSTSRLGATESPEISTTNHNTSVAAIKATTSKAPSQVPKTLPVRAKPGSSSNSPAAKPVVAAQKKASVTNSKDQKESGNDGLKKRGLNRS
jgi:hypothetical protein